MALKPLEKDWIDQLAQLGRTPTLENPAPPVERLGPGSGSELTSPLSALGPYGQQGPALRDPAVPQTGPGNEQGLLSVDEHVQPFGIDKRITRNPATGKSFLEEPAVDASGQPILLKGGPKVGTQKMVDAKGPKGDMTTPRTTRTTGNNKNIGDEQVIQDYDKAEQAARDQKGSFDPFEDLTDAQKQAMSPQSAIERQMAAAKQAGDTSVTLENVTTGVHGQEGVKSEYGKTGQAQETSDILDGLDVDDFVENNQFEPAKGYLDPIMPAPKPGASPAMTPPEGIDPAAPAVAEPVATAAPTAATAAADGATSAESGAVSGASGGIASAGVLGGVIAGGITLASDAGKVLSGKMSVADAAKDAGVKTVETGVLTAGGVAVAKQVASTTAEAGGVVGGIVSAGIALVDDVGKVADGTMTGGQATADVGTKGAIGVAAGALGAMAGGAVAGSELGAALGTIVPGAGNVVGFVAGAAVGAAVGLVGNALAETETGQKVEAAVGSAVDAGIDVAKDAGHAIANFFSGDDDASK